MSSVFDTHARQYDSWYEKNKYAYLSEIVALKRAMPRKGTGLEIGVGTGRFAAPLGITIGIDPSRAMLELARRKGLSIRLGRGEAVPFLNGVFDYVAIIITLCFAKNPKKVLEEAHRVLKKRGSIIIGIVDKESFLGKSYRRKKSGFYKQATFFGVAQVTDLLAEVGFGFFSYWQTLSALPATMVSVEKPRKGFGQGGFVVIKGMRR